MSRSVVIDLLRNELRVATLSWRTYLPALLIIVCVMGLGLLTWFDLVTPDRLIVSLNGEPPDLAAYDEIETLATGYNSVILRETVKLAISSFLILIAMLLLLSFGGFFSAVLKYLFLPKADWIWTYLESSMVVEADMNKPLIAIFTIVFITLAVGLVILHGTNAPDPPDRLVFTVGSIIAVLLGIVAFFLKYVISVKQGVLDYLAASVENNAESARVLISEAVEAVTVFGTVAFIAVIAKITLPDLLASSSRGLKAQLLAQDDYFIESAESLGLSASLIDSVVNNANKLAVDVPGHSPGFMNVITQAFSMVVQTTGVLVVLYLVLGLMVPFIYVKLKKVRRAGKLPLLFVAPLATIAIFIALLAVDLVAGKAFPSYLRFDRGGAASLTLALGAVMVLAALAVPILEGLFTRQIDCWFCQSSVRSSLMFCKSCSMPLSVAREPSYIANVRRGTIHRRGCPHISHMKAQHVMVLDDLSEIDSFALIPCSLCLGSNRLLGPN